MFLQKRITNIIYVSYQDRLSSCTHSGAKHRAYRLVFVCLFKSWPGLKAPQYTQQDSRTNKLNKLKSAMPQYCSSSSTWASSQLQLTGFPTFLFCWGAQIFQWIFPCFLCLYGGIKGEHSYSLKILSSLCFCCKLQQRANSNTNGILHEQNIFHRYKSWCHTGSTLDLSFNPRQLGGNPGVHSWSISQGTSISPGYHSYHREIPPSPFWRNQWSSWVTLAGILACFSGTDHGGGDIGGGVERVGSAHWVGDGEETYFIKYIWLRSVWVESTPARHHDLSLLIVLGWVWQTNGCDRVGECDIAGETYYGKVIVVWVSIIIWMRYPSWRSNHLLSITDSDIMFSKVNPE